MVLKIKVVKGGPDMKTQKNMFSCFFVVLFSCFFFLYNEDFINLNVGLQLL